MSLLFRDDAYLKSCAATVTAVGDGQITLDRTVFYPMGGGQPGDTGWLRWNGGETRIVDARKGDGPDTVVHVAEDDDALPAPGAEVEALIDWDRRHRLMRMHTAMHLLCSIVDGDVTGGQVGAEKSRLDFNVPAGALDKEAIGAALNGMVEAALPVSSLWIADEELEAKPELVRTMSVKPPTGAGKVRLLLIGAEDDPADLQPCGGTHVANTSEIGALKIGKIENKGRQNRRVNILLDDG